MENKLRTFDSDGMMENKRLTPMIKPENTFDSNAFRCICLSDVEFLLWFISKDSLSAFQLTMHRSHRTQNGIVNKPTNAISITGSVFLRKFIQMACNVQFRFVFRCTCYNWTWKLFVIFNEKQFTVCSDWFSFRMHSNDGFSFVWTDLAKWTLPFNLKLVKSHNI